MGLVGILTGVAQRLALAQEVPQLVELEANLQALPVLRQVGGSEAPSYGAGISSRSSSNRSITSRICSSLHDREIPSLASCVPAGRSLRDDRRECQISGVMLSS